LELLDSIFKFFTDKTKGLSHKAIFVILTITALVVIDNTLSFSYFFNTQNKIEQIQGLNKILNDTTLTSNERKEIQIIRKDIIFRSTWKDKTFNFISQIEFKSEPSDSTIKIDSEPVFERSYFWHFITSGWAFIIVMILMPFVGLFSENTSIGNLISILIILEPILYGMAWIFAKLFSLIPVLFGDPTYNYLVNIVLSSALTFLITLSTKKSRKTID